MEFITYSERVTATFESLFVGRAVRIKTVTDLQAVMKSQRGQNANRNRFLRMTDPENRYQSLAGQAGVVISVDMGDRTVQVKATGTTAAEDFYCRGGEAPTGPTFIPGLLFLHSDSVNLSSSFLW